ncbi:MAG: C69 family dipeptidase [Promethearchaeota archaeon]
MCDTYVCLGDSSFDGSVIFGKNSDRLSNEPQLIAYAPRMKHEKGTTLKCTYIEIPQVSETASVLLSEPWWMWGAEMGTNEYGVVIGNEAVATKEPLKDTGLLGMDLLRLGLERGKSAKEALNVVIDLLEKYGQGGKHNLKGLNYHNSMIIADPMEAYVLETAGEWWIVENVKSIRSISNNISIRGKGDMRRKGIVQHAIEKEYCKDDNDFDFKMIFSASPLPDKFPLDSRDGCSMSQLMQNKGNITPHMMMDFLRTHEPVFICMHGRNDRSVASQVSHLRKNNKSIHFLTGSTNPCLSVFKPYVFPLENQIYLTAGPYPEIDPEWFWVKHDNYVKPCMRKPNKENGARAKFQQFIKEAEKDITEQIKNNTDFNAIHQEAWKKSEEMIK